MKVKVIGVVYWLTTVIVVVCQLLQIFRTKTFLDPDAMLPMTWSDVAFGCLMLMVIPCLIAGILYYFICEFNQKKNKYFYLLMIMIPAFICVVNAAYFLIPFLYSLYETAQEVQQGIR